MSRARRGLRWAVRAGLVLLAVLVLGVVWLGVRGLAAQHQLEQARADLVKVRTSVGAGDVTAATSSLRRARRATAAAHRLTSDPVWRTAGSVPWLGAAPHAVTTSADVADQVASQVLPPLVSVADGLDLSTLRSGSGLRLGPLEQARPALTRASRGIDAQQRRMAALHGPLPGPVGSAVRSLNGQLAELAGMLRTASDLADLLPPLLGSGGDRRYLVVIQNPAESRGTGGLIGAYGVLEASRGQVALKRLGPNGDLSSAERVPVDLGADFTRLYGQDPALWSNANLSPYFPYAARIWLALWDRQFHQRLDGVIATDPVALGHLVGAVGPIVLAGDTELTGETTADFVMKGAYELYPRDQDSAERDKLLIDVGRATLDRLLSPDVDVPAVVSALATSAEEHRLKVYSTRPAEETRLLGTAVGGNVGRGRGPFLEVVVNNGGANKLDVYLQRSVSWQLGPCDGPTRGSRVTIRLTNTAPPTGLPPYAVGRRIFPVDGGPALPPGSNRLLVTVFTSPGTTLTGAELDEEPLAVRTGRERGLTVTGFTVDLGPGGARTAVLQLDGPTRPGRPHLQVQPLVLPQRSVVDGQACGPQPSAAVGAPDR